MPEYELPPEEVCEELRRYSALGRTSKIVEPVKLTLLLGQLRAEGYTAAALAYVCNLSPGSVYARLRNYRRYQSGEDLPGFPSHWEVGGA